jgi:oxygen-dependent protoporphyrinogen oxidase
MNSVAIVGAGITGLTAAFRLEQRGVPVVVYEAAAQPGGMIQTLRQDGYLVEQGPNTIMSSAPEVGDLIRDLGLEDYCLKPAPDASVRYIVRDRKMVQIPGSAKGAVSTTLLSTGAKLRVFAEPFISRGDDPDESLASFVRRRLGDEFLDYLINPFVGGVYAGDPEKLSVAQGFPKLWRLEQRYGSLIKGAVFGARERRKRSTPSKASAPMFTFESGISFLTETLAKRLDGSMRLNCPVLGLSQHDEGWTVHTGNGPFRHTSVLLCSPSFVLPEISSQFAGLERIYYPPVARVAFGFKREQVAHSLVGFGGLVPERECMNILGVLFSSSMFPRRAPEGHVLLTVFAGGARAPWVGAASADDIAKLALADVRELLGITGEPVFQDVLNLHKAIPQYNVGHGHFKELAASIEQRLPGVFLGGNYRDGISVADCIAGGQADAENVGSYYDKVCLVTASCS